jgi:predicted nucleotidyltransferase
MLISDHEGNKKVYRVNVSHPLFNDIRNIIMKTIGFDQIIDKVIERMGDVEKVYITGSFARGINSNIIDLLFIGKNINTDYLFKLIEKAEKLIKRRIRYLAIKPEDLGDYIVIGEHEALLLWDMKK